MIGTAGRMQLILAGVLGVNVGLLPAALYEMGVMPWLIGLGVIVVFAGLFVPANFSHLFSEMAAVRAKIALCALVGMASTFAGLIYGFLG